MDRGHELLNILIQEMENNSDRLIVIFAGYTDEMRTLLQKNPGLGSRIARQIQFDDYSLEELVQIFLMRCKKDGFTLHPSAQDELEDCISALMTREFFGNARDVENMLQDLKESWSEEYYEKLTKHSTEDTKLEKVFYPHHFDKIMPPKKEISINDLIGLDTLKAKLEVFKKQALYQKFLREKGFTSHMDFSMHMIFTGNPGTGKTSVAKLIADDLYSIGMLKTNRLVVTERKDLISNYGDTGKKAADVIRKAVGGVLFVDEAYSLADGRRSGLGNEVIEVYLTAMEEHKSGTVFIFAGYVDEMQEFIAMNPGIQSRIGYTFHFEDYSAEELTRMFTDKMHKTGFEVSDDAVQKVRDIMEYFHGTKNFGNGRFVNHVIHKTISQRANRDFTEHYRSITGEDIPSIKTLIETAPNNMHLYDPAIITDEERRRTAVHELGHALVMVATDPKNVPESISIRNHAESLGRVRQAEMNINLTEQQLMNHLATLLGGKNAEKLIFGSHSTGCSNDYTRAKRVAQNMIDNYAMTQFGESVADILKAADKLSMDIIQSHQHQLDIIADTLLKQMQLSGQEFMTLLDLKQA
jgi:AAA+ superfamily predicted ATPase